MNMAASSGESAFVKQLAANDRKTRDQAVQNLRTYLSHRKNFAELELLKLWKGLFYCMWMSDRPRTQQQLARDLAALVDVLQDAAVLDFLDAFWKTMAREWGGIDVLRMNKFLYLIRMYLHASFQYFARIGWKDTAKLDEYMEILKTTPLNARNGKIPNGLRYHMLDIYLDEVDKVDQDRAGKLPLKTLLEPLAELGEESPTKAVRKKVKEILQDERLRDWNSDGKDISGIKRKKRSADDDEEEEVAAEQENVEWTGFDD